MSRIGKQVINLNKYGPLWMRTVPKYPVYAEGGPQNRVFLCPFWMKLVKPSREIPPNIVHFIVHPQMSKLDVKQYLEKIYKVPVLSVKTKIESGEDIYLQPVGDTVHGRRDDVKYAIVNLGDGQKFEFPDIFHGKGSEAEKEREQKRKAKDLDKDSLIEEEVKKVIPEWF